MNSVILRTAAVFILPLLLMFSVVVLLRGHNEPGGGFVGGLLASAAFVLYLLSAGPAAARRLLRIDPRTLFGVGLFLALVSGLFSPVAGGALFGSMWTDAVVLGEVKIGTPLLFDIGVYFTVTGVVLGIAFELSESTGHSQGVTPDPSVTDGGIS